MDRFIDFLSAIKPLNQEEKRFLENNIPVQHIDKGAFLLRKGEVSKSFFFIIKGCVRLFYEVGIEERTAFFYLEDQFVSSYDSYVNQIPAKHNLQCIEETHVAEISQEHAFLLLEKFPQFEFLARIIMEHELVVYQDIIASFVTLTPEERYLNILENNPQLLDRIPQYYLATFIGVKPESLSRIRKRIVRDKNS